MLDMKWDYPELESKKISKKWFLVSEKINIFYASPILLQIWSELTLRNTQWIPNICTRIYLAQWYFSNDGCLFTLTTIVLLIIASIKPHAVKLVNSLNSPVSRGPGQRILNTKHPPPERRNRRTRSIETRKVPVRCEKSVRRETFNGFELIPPEVECYFLLEGARSDN